VLVRLRTGAGGIAEYLELGRKRGREFERSVLDQRIPLHGNLAQVGQTIASMQTRSAGASRYLHITLGFSERFVEGGGGAGEINLERIKQAERLFRERFMVAFDPSEYQWYAEAHLPKLEHLVGEDGLERRRLPHIHVVIPLRNLVTGKYLNPRGHGIANLHYIDAIQESINRELGLNSPKQQRRMSLPDPLARHSGQSRQLHRMVSDAIESNGVSDLDELARLLAKEGEVRVRQGRAGRYLNVRPKLASKGINLKAYDESYFNRRLSVPSGAFDPQLEVRLAEWLERAAFVARYVTSGKQAEFERMTPEQQLSELATKRQRSMERLQEALSPRGPDGPVALPDANTHLLQKTAQARAPQKAQTLSALHADSLARTRSNLDTPTDAQLKNETHAEVVLAFARRHLTLGQADCRVGVAADGRPRILVDGKQHNLADFFTKHLKLTWSETRPILEQCWRSSNIDALQVPSPELWQRFRDSLKQPGDSTTAQLRGKSHGQRGRAARYRDFLCGQAEIGDMDALHELRLVAAIGSDDKHAVGRLSGRRNRPTLLGDRPFRVDEVGGVIYFIGQRALVRDLSHAVSVLESTRQAYEMALELAERRFGRELTLTGDAVFLGAMRALAMDKNLHLIFTSIHEFVQDKSVAQMQPRRPRL
jgi:hypothetical protein